MISIIPLARFSIPSPRPADANIKVKPNGLLLSSTLHCKVTRMRLLCYLSIVALLACSPQESADDAKRPDTLQTACGNSVITGQGIGHLVIRRSVDSVRIRCPILQDSTEMDNEGMPAHVLRVQVGNDTVKATAVSGAIWRIAVTSPHLRTADSIGVGTPIARLLRFRDPKAWPGEGGMFLMTPELCGLSFELSDNAGFGRVLEKPQLERLPANTIVKRVLITGCGQLQITPLH